MKQPKSQTMTNNEFLSVITESFKAFLYKGTSRSTDKLKPLHGAIAEDIAFRLGNGYDVWSKGFYHDSEIRYAKLFAELQQLFRKYAR